MKVRNTYFTPVATASTVLPCNKPIVHKRNNTLLLLEYPNPHSVFLTADLWPFVLS